MMDHQVTILADDTKRQVKSLVLELRTALEDDLARELKRLGLDVEGMMPTALTELSYLTPEEKATRWALDAALTKALDVAEGDYPTAVHSLLREAVYTHLNRLFGLKCLELRGHLIIEEDPTEAVTCRPEYSGRPKWLWTLRECENRYRFGEQAEETLWREGLTRAYEAVTEEIAVLFDPHDPYASVWPAHRALRMTTDKLNELPEETYHADELLGWVYQYFQTEEKLKVTSGESFIQKRRKTKKYEGEDIATYTSLYTERYMVDFLLQNSLGRLWMEMYPESEAKKAWPYYVEPASLYTRERKPLKEWKLLDPCTGSGHFLVVAFDLLRQMYSEERQLAERGEIPADWAVEGANVGVTILERNLHGIDIDARAIQLASLALYLKGKEAGLSRVPRMHLVAADASFMSGDAWDDFLGSFEREPSVRRVLEALSKSLEHTGELGTLLRPEEELRRIITEEHVRWEAQVRRKREENYLFPEMHSEAQGLPFEEITDELFWERLSYRVEAALRGFIDEAREKGELETQVVAGEAHKGFLFMELLQQRYDVVCTNPPYLGSGNMGKVVKDYVGKEYKPGKSDLYAAFILRNRELAIEDGYVAMVTQQSWMFLKSYADLRALDEEKLARAEPDEFRGLLRETSIETLAHLGAGAFGEISGEVVNCALFTLRRSTPTTAHQMVALRLIGPKGPTEKDGLLRSSIANGTEEVQFAPKQRQFLGIPQSPLCYWLRPRFFELLAGRTLGDVASVCAGLQTGDDKRFVRYHWEVLPSELRTLNRKGRWVAFEKGGGYGRWFGFHWWVVDWKDDGKAIKDNRDTSGKLLSRPQNQDYYFQSGLTYSGIARGALGVRVLQPGSIFSCRAASGIFPRGDGGGLMAVLNCRFASAATRALAQNLQMFEGAVARVPLPEAIPSTLWTLEQVCLLLKKDRIAKEPTEASSHDAIIPDVPRTGVGAKYLPLAVCHALEGWSEHLVLAAYGFDDEDMSSLFSELGRPAAMYPLIAAYDTLPDCSEVASYSKIAEEFSRHVSDTRRVRLDEVDLCSMKERIRGLYTAGPGSQLEHDTLNEIVDGAEIEEVEVAGAYIPIPTETFLEELSQKLEIHPISVYWLLEELHAEGVVCGPERNRETENYLTVKTLRLLGHRWPMQDQYEEERGEPFLDSKWIDEDGIIPLIAGTGEETLADRLRRYLDDEYGSDRGPEVEKEITMALGWKAGQQWGSQKAMSLDHWLEREFFKRHVSQFKKRPIAWHLTSEKGTFQTIVYYHKFDKNRLQLLRSRYMRQMLDELQRELGATRGESMNREALARVEELENKIEDVRRFDERLQLLLEGRERDARIWCPWKSEGEQPQGWDPDINDGVRVNIAPIQRLELLAGPVLSKKDLNSLLAPEERS